MEKLTEAQQELYDWLKNYIRVCQHSPSIRQMMQAMKLKSPAPIQSRLEHLRNKGYIEWSEGKARTIRILKSCKSSIPVLGVIAASGLLEPSTDTLEQIDFTNLNLPAHTYALRINGNSMIEDSILDGDLVFLSPVLETSLIKNGTIVAAKVEGHGTSLKQFYRQGDNITLKLANPQYQSIEVSIVQVEVQGSLVGIWRHYQ
ncbi:SOS-response repressor and protease LexA [Richelia intracellularis HH01]|uniref:LexA repressor n=1 Tax=Richelia intracellularis HH01 TaxID=1165094 RepID=M1WYP8_9NOST|nr:transcriptional repressor LexA [Richelia intracellularis]CCH66987.1 SOS-response repressor and protease LexA [Richelia intracellularis HH01]HAE05896.1 repressor LexA [Richelia sp.]